MTDVLFATVLSLLAIFLILLVLVQRGRGGGLAGALGGMGGSSAFGAKAGDVFTRITIITAAIWITICLVAVFWAEHGGDALSTATPASTPARSAPLDIPRQGLPGGPTAPASDARPEAPPAESGAVDGAATGGAADNDAATPPAENQ